MKKLLIVFLALMLMLGGLFIWKGGHHALILAEELEDWLDEDAGEQRISLQISIPACSKDEEIGMVVRQMSLIGDGYWTEHNDRTVYGLTTNGYSVYLIGNTLYMDNGTAYAMPELRTYKAQLKEFLTGLLLYGRVTKTDQSYRVEMECEELTFSAVVVLDRGISSVTVNLGGQMNGQPVQILAELTPKEPESHPLPQPVLDAMVRAKMEPPMSITEPLQVLLPAVETLLPLEADVTLAVDCGILTISEPLGLTIDDTGAELIRNGEAFPLSLPDGLDGIDPLTAGLAILRSGSFTRDGDRAESRITLPPEETAELVCQLIPQAASLGISFTKSEAALIFSAGELVEAAVSAEGALPFLVTTIPLSFSAKFEIT